ncbi:MAG: class I SAM-dependent methyltransferase [bacterium]
MTDIETPAPTPSATPPVADGYGPRAQAYRAFRPRYPRALFHYLATVTHDNRSAWDVGAGNGQAAVGIAERWARVLATDPSEEMIAMGVAHPRVRYAVATYDSGLPDHSVSLVTVAQALHWMDATALMREVRRVLVPGGIFAAWCYSRCRLSDPLDAVVDQFHRVTVGSYWPPERRMVDDGYRAIALPLDEHVPPPFDMVEDWTYETFRQYVRTWSGLVRYVEARGEEAVLTFEQELLEGWGKPTVRRQVRWPLSFRIGEVR